MNNQNANYINQSITKMLNSIPVGNGFQTDYRIIRSTFACNDSQCNRPLTKDDIHLQLVLIDSLYSTNVRRMRQFGIEGLRDEIWSLCEDARGNHTLDELRKKLEIIQPLLPQVKNVFSKPFGYIKGVKNSDCPSLISKYFFFVMVACYKNGWGFPIYDSIVCNSLRKLQKFLDIPLTPFNKISNINGTLDMDIYIDGLKRVIDVLEANDPTLWNHSGKLKFELLDLFLWHIGKANNENYSLLLMENEVLNYYNNGKVLPNRVKDWKNAAQKIGL